jgi:hypothetical protein
MTWVEMLVLAGGIIASIKYQNEASETMRTATIARQTDRIASDGRRQKGCCLRSRAC